MKMFVSSRAGLLVLVCVLLCSSERSTATGERIIIATYIAHWQLTTTGSL